MNLHDFVTEPLNLDHIFRGERIVPFCLTAHHISTCLMMFSARFKPAQFWSALDVLNGSIVSALISDDGISGTCQHPWSPMENWYGDLVWKLVNTHGVS